MATIHIINCSQLFAMIASRAIIGHMNVDGRGSALVHAKEKTTGRIIGKQFFFLKDGPVPVPGAMTVPVYATLNIQFNQYDFPNVQSSADIELIMCSLLTPNTPEAFSGQINGIADEFGLIST
jgi:hypothetical protein